MASIRSDAAAATAAPEELRDAVELGHGTYALSNALRVDDRTSWLRPGRSEYAPMNTYLVRGQSAGLVIDPGITVHGESVVDQLSSLVADDFELSLLFSRLGEFNCASNGAILMERFDVKSVWGAYPVENFLDFLPGAAMPPASPSDWHGNDVEVHELGGNLNLPIDDERAVLVFSSPLRLIATHWTYDRAGKVLFSSDSFSHVYRSPQGKPWVVESAAEDDTTEDQVRDHLLVKFGWLGSAEIGDIRRDLATIFERLDVETIAPSYGCVLRGRDVVERHYEMVQSALRSLDRSAAGGKDRL